LAWQCPKGMGNAGNPNAGIKGKGQTWELANVNPGPTEDIAQTMALEESVPVWTGNKQEDLNLGGTWDNSIGLVSNSDNAWNVVMRRARGQHDLRPIRFIQPIRHFCDRGNCVDSLERSGKMVNCINEVTRGQTKWETITVTVDSGAVDSVGPPTMAAAIKIKDTPASRAGMKYRAVNGTTIANQGEKVIQGVRKGAKSG